MDRDRPAEGTPDAAQWDAVEEATELLHEERYHEALRNLREVLEADPKNAYAYFFLGQALYEVGELEASRDAYRACVTLAPQHLGARIALCHVLRKTGEVRDAIKEGMAALDQSSQDSDALYAVGLAYLARGDDPAARRYLEAFLRHKPELEIRMEVEGILAGMADRDGSGGNKPN